MTSCQWYVLGILSCDPNAEKYLEHKDEIWCGENVIRIKKAIEKNKVGNDTCKDAFKDFFESTIVSDGNALVSMENKLEGIRYHFLENFQEKRLRSIKSDCIAAVLVLKYNDAH